jgi:hypothetical protein
VLIVQIQGKALYQEISGLGDAKTSAGGGLMLPPNDHKNGLEFEGTLTCA